MQKESKSFFWRFGNPLEEQEERLKVSEWVVDARRTCPPNQLSGFHMASARLKLPVSRACMNLNQVLCVFSKFYLTVSEFYSITSEFFFTEYVLFLSSTLGYKYYKLNLLNKDLKFTQVQ